MTSSLLLAGGQIIEPANDPPISGPSDLLIVGGKIADISEPGRSNSYDVASKINIEGCWLVPGFIDLQFDPFLGPDNSMGRGQARSVAERVSIAERTLRETLAVGVTTVGTVGAEDDLDVDLRDAIDTGDLEGPRVLAAGGALNLTDPAIGSADSENGLVADNARRAARERIKAGVDHLRITLSADTPSLTHGDAQHLDEMLRAVMEEVRAAGLPAIAVVTSPESAEACIQGGVTAAEVRSTDALIPISAAQIPTILSFDGVSSAMPRSEGDVRPMTPYDFINFDQQTSPMSVGSGGPGTYRPLPDQCIELLTPGLSPMEAIKAVTLNPARILGRPSEIGTLRVGALGDCFVVPGDPLHDASVLNAPAYVVKGGEVVATND